MSRTRLYSRQAWDKNASIYEAIRTMPFNAQLASGTLSDARFRHYITQDAHYLTHNTAHNVTRYDLVMRQVFMAGSDDE
jgi:thiaminase